MDADPKLPLALALAPPAVALAMLDVAIYRRKQEPGTGLRSLDRAIGDGEEEIREDDEDGKGQTHRRFQPSLLLAGGQPATATGGARAGAWSGGACVRPWSAPGRGARSGVINCFMGWAVFQRPMDHKFGPPNLTTGLLHLLLPFDFSFKKYLLPFEF